MGASARHLRMRSDAPRPAPREARSSRSIRRPPARVSSSRPERVRAEPSRRALPFDAVARPAAKARSACERRARRLVEATWPREFRKGCPAHRPGVDVPVTSERPCERTRVPAAKGSTISALPFAVPPSEHRRRRAGVDLPRREGPRPSSLRCRVRAPREGSPSDEDEGARRGRNARRAARGRVGGSGAPAPYEPSGFSPETMRSVPRRNGLRVKDDRDPRRAREGRGLRESDRASVDPGADDRAAIRHRIVIASREDRSRDGVARAAEFVEGLACETRPLRPRGMGELRHRRRSLARRARGGEAQNTAPVRRQRRRKGRDPALQ